MNREESKRNGVILIDINTRQLRYFMELAKCLNFTKAAMNLYLAQPALSQQIADLEKQLGVTLFERNSRTVILTPAGEILQKACPEILAKLEGIEQQLLRAKAGLRGHIKIGYNVVFQPILTSILQEFRRIYPDIVPDLFSGSLQELKNGLESGELDIAFSWIDHRALPQKRAPSIQVLWEEDLCLVLRRDHPFVTSGGTDYSLLENETFIMTEDTPNLGLTKYVVEAANEIGLVMKHTVTSKQFSTILIQIETRMGVSILPGWMKNYEFYASDNIVFIPIKEKCLDFGIIWHEDSTNAVLPLFLDLLDTTLNPIEEPEAESNEASE